MSYETVTARQIRDFGVPVSLERDGTGLGEGRAILRPVLDEKAQFTPTSLGTARTEEVLCLGEAGLAFPDDPDRVVLRQGETAYDVRTVRLVTMGALPLYWRAVLRRRAEEEAMG